MNRAKESIWVKHLIFFVISFLQGKLPLLLFSFSTHLVLGDIRSHTKEESSGI
jgi:hypothetical protein